MWVRHDGRKTENSERAEGEQSENRSGDSITTCHKIVTVLYHIITIPDMYFSVILDLY